MKGFNVGAAHAGVWLAGVWHDRDSYVMDVGLGNRASTPPHPQSFSAAVRRTAFACAEVLALGFKTRMLCAHSRQNKKRSKHAAEYGKQLMPSANFTQYSDMCPYNVNFSTCMMPPLKLRKC